MQVHQSEPHAWGGACLMHEHVIIIHDLTGLGHEIASLTSLTVSASLICFSELSETSRTLSLELPTPAFFLRR